MKCPNCGREDADGRDFCFFCGKALTVREERPAFNMDRDREPNQETTKVVGNSAPTVITRIWNSGALILGIVVIGLAFLGFIAIFLANRQDVRAHELAQIAQATAMAQASAATAIIQAHETATAQATQQALMAATVTAQAVTQTYNRGIAAMELGDWPTAYRMLSQVLEVDSTYRDVVERMRIVSAALTPTPTPLPTATATPLPTETNTPTATATPSPLPTDTATPAPTATPTDTPPPTITPTPTPTASETPTSPPTFTPTATPLPTATLPVTAVRIVAEGIGSAPPDETNPARREYFALLAAETVAKRALAEWLEGAEVTAVTVISEGAVDYDYIRTEVKAKLPSTEVIERLYDDTNGDARVKVQMVVNLPQ